MAKTGKLTKNAGADSMQTGNTASVVDGKLILSFPLAKNPVIWQMDLNKAKSCALEVKEDKKKKEFSLCLKTDSQETENIAAFETKEQAVEALMSTSAAMQNANGHINPVPAPAATTSHMTPTQGAPSSYTQNSESNDNKKAAIIAFILVITLIVVWSFSVPRNGGSLLSSNQIGESTSTGSNTSESGVPVSAEEFLLQR